MTGRAPGPRRHLVETSLGTVHLRSTGEPHPGRPSLLFLHQVPASSRMWLPVMEALAPLACVAPDMLNLGESDRSPRPVGLEEHAELLLDAAQQVLPGPTIVVGHHTGAALAACLAVSHPDQVRGACLVGYPLYRDWEEQLSRLGWMAPVAVARDGEGLVDLWTLATRPFRPNTDDASVLTAFVDRLRAGRVWYEGYVALFASDLEQILAGLGASGCPTMVVAPSNDPLTRSAERVGDMLGVVPRAVPGGTFVLVEDAPLIAGCVRELADAVSP